MLKQIAKREKEKEISILKELGLNLEGDFLDFLDSFKKLSRNRELSIEKRNILNNYPKLFSIVSPRFKEATTFVSEIHNLFFKITEERIPIPFDTTEYRYSILQGWSENWKRFSYAGQFSFAIDVVFDYLSREEE